MLNLADGIVQVEKHKKNTETSIIQYGRIAWNKTLDIWK